MTTLSLGGGVWAHADLAPLLTPIDGTGVHPPLTPHPRNARNGDTEAIAASVRANGLYRPVYAQQSTGHLLAGNHTYAACMELSDGHLTHLPVVWLDVDDEAALRILLVDNRAADLGRYDDPALRDLLLALDGTETSLDGTGYTAEDLTALDAAINATADIIIGEFPSFDTDLDTAYRCPSCGYEWSGQPAPGVPTHEAPDA